MAFFPRARCASRQASIRASTREAQSARLGVPLRTNLQLADGIVSGTFTSPTVYGVRAEMIGNASRAVDDRSLGTDQVDVQTRIHVPLPPGTAGCGSAAASRKPWRVAVISSADVHRRRRLGQARRRRVEVRHRDAHGDVHEFLIQQSRVGARHAAPRSRARPSRRRRSSSQRADARSTSAGARRLRAPVALQRPRRLAALGGRRRSSSARRAAIASATPMT